MSSHLIEPGVKSYLSQSLRKCHNVKLTYYNYYYNILLFIVFFLLFGGLLFYMYKGKLSPVEKREKMKQERQYILQKIKTLQIEKEKQMNKNSMITNLPEWEGPYRA